MSLQDSVRTTTTLSTLNGSSSNGAAVGGGRSSQRMQRGSLNSSHATLLSTQSRSRQDLFATRVAGADAAAVAAAAIVSAATHPHPHRTLQTQISQLSSVGDAHSLLEAELQWPEEHYELVARHKCPPTSMGAIDELSCQSSVVGGVAAAGGLSRSRLKLTRITRQPQLHTSGPLVHEEAAAVAATMAKSTGSGKVRKAKAKRSNTLKGLKAKLNWRGRRKEGANDVADGQQKSQTGVASTPSAVY